ncbi:MULTISPECIES: ATP-binding cassette domain-containing protein [unclassified Microbacterium]|uniref:ATP-binding cassette domain-containing protein n=1 Tax=unclassified Microbacterium TaxID=2609290 RepID=UPI001AC6BB67|nr:MULTISPECIES: ATP-binding cassette domain-containing protein [unclassified Microbacterium]MBN9158431.1 sugar ABC transporter ATP-binding protein [Microbacterium sp.]
MNALRGETAVAASGAPHDVVLRAVGIRKQYGHVVAVRDSDFELRRGEILSVIGDNGAGKSSLIKVLSGDVIPDAGQIYLNGAEVAFKSPKDAQRAGIETVYQDLAMVPDLDIASNLYLGREKRFSGGLGSVLRMLDSRAMQKHAQQSLDDLGISTLQSITQRVETLSGGQRQTVAVARAAIFGTNVVIMDEPTAALGVRETKGVLDLIRSIRDAGRSVVLISHDIPSVYEISDHIHIHRLGRRIALRTPADQSMNDLVGVMTGALPAD